eukprot:jgi/Chlat1/3666/Chrsp24S03841
MERASSMAAAAAEDEENAAQKPPSPAAARRGDKKKSTKTFGRRLLQRLRRWYILQSTDFWRKAINEPLSHTYVPLWLRDHLTYYRLHLTYFIVTILISSIFMWGNWGENTQRLRYIDALFLSTSAMSVTGLATVDMASLSVLDQVVLTLLMLAGSQVFMSLIPVFVRRYYFKRAVLEMTFREHPPTYSAPLLAQPHGQKSPAAETNSTGSSIREGPQLRRPSAVVVSPMREPVDESAVNLQPRSSKKAFHYYVQRTFQIVRPQLARSATASIAAPQTGQKNAHFMRKLTTLDSSWRVPDTSTRLESANFDPNITWSAGEDPLLLHILQQHRNSLSHIAGDPTPITGMELLETVEKLQRLRTRATRSVGPSSDVESPRTDFSVFDEEYLADEACIAEASKRLRQSIEYNALRELSMLVPLYFVVIQLAGFLLIRIDFIYDKSTSNVLRKPYHINPWWFSLFQSVSAFNNAGFSLLSANMIPFQRATLVLLVASALILLGNTAYPIALRAIVWFRARYARSDEQRDACNYLLKYPRRCFTHLFPASQTRVLFITLVVINSTEFFFFQVLDWNSLAVKGLGAGYKLLVGLFQSFSTRSAGLNAVNIALLSPAMQWLYTGLMYVAVYPLYISRQRSQVTDEYEMKELGLTKDELLLEKAEADHVWVQGRKLLLRDTVFLFVSIFLICIIEKSQFELQPSDFQVFAVLFEVISAYGNVGLSLGYPNVVFAFCGTWHTLSKLVLVVVMLLGRHRGLPENIDKALQLPKNEMASPSRTHRMFSAHTSPASGTHPPSANNTFTPATQQRQAPTPPTQFQSHLERAMSKAVARVNRSTSFPTRPARGMPEPTSSVPKTRLARPSSDVSELLRGQSDRWLPTVREGSHTSLMEADTSTRASLSSSQQQEPLDVSTRNATQT